MLVYPWKATKLSMCKCVVSGDEGSEIKCNRKRWMCWKEKEAFSRPVAFSFKIITSHVLSPDSPLPRGLHLLLVTITSLNFVHPFTWLSWLAFPYENINIPFQFPIINGRELWIYNWDCLSILVLPEGNSSFFIGLALRPTLYQVVLGDLNIFSLPLDLFRHGLIA